MKATHIYWDTDTEEERIALPREIEIPEDIDETDDDKISDYITNVTGYCHCGFILEDN